MKSSLAAALLAAACPLFAATTETPIPRAGETIEVSIVNLDVIVTDKLGQRVHGLTKDDFQVFEDGKPQAISNFAAYAPEAKSEVIASKSGVSMPAAPAETAKRQRRTIAIFIEDFRLPEDRVRTIFDSMKKTLHELVAPGDAVLIATWNLRTRVRLDYTDTLASIDAALDQIAKESSHVAPDLIDNHLARLNEIRAFLNEAAQMNSEGHSGLTMNPESINSALAAEASDPALREKARMRAKAAAINSFISTMSNDEGRKVMLLMTQRFSQITGGEYFYAINPGDPLDPSKRGDFSSYSLLEAIKATANAHGVTIYAFYPPGLDTQTFSSPTLSWRDGLPSTRASAFNHQVLDNELAALDDITKATGGTTSWGSVNIAEALPRIREDFEDYYSLAYRVTARNDNRARKVAVKAKNRDYVVRTRQQYMEKSDDNRVRDLVVASLYRPPAASGIAVEATLGTPVKKDQHRYVVPVSVRVPVASFLTTQDGAVSRGAFSVYVATGRVVGETSDISKQTIPFTVADGEKAQNGYFTYNFDLLTDFATNRLAVGIYDEVSHDSGFARVDLYAIKE
jgi:VWFA-related protein